MENVVVLNCGSHSCKAGLAFSFPNDEEPRVIVPPRVRVSPELQPDGTGSALNGSCEEQTATTPVVERGAVVHWDGMEALAREILYEELGWEVGDEGCVLIAEALFTSKAEKEQMTQLLFEEFNVSGLFCCDEPVLSLYSIGKISGCVVDLGHSKTDIAVVLEGQVYHPATRRLYHGGADVTGLLARLVGVKSEGALVQGGATWAAVETLKECCARVADSKAALAEMPLQDEEPEMQELSNGHTVALTQRMRCQLGEAMLDPGAMGLEGVSVAEAVFGAAMCHTDPSTRKATLESILVCGGGSTVPGLPTRLLRDVRALCPPSIAPGLLAVPEYMPEHTLQYAAWVGGAVLSKVVFQQSQHITKFDYEDAGPSVVHRKC